MTRLHHIPHEHHKEFVLSRAGSGHKRSLTRREFLRSGVFILSGLALPRFLGDLSTGVAVQEMVGKRIYIAPDDHTDLFWTADLATYQNAFVKMLDYYLDLADTTANEPAEFQSRWNCDGSFWAWTYEKKKSQAEFERLIERIRDGHIGLPLNALCVCLGGAPAEAVLRGMYYPGKLERRYGLRFNLAYSMENQTLPLGLGSLWQGAGATFSWKGICGCATHVPDAWDREHDIYWWVGTDGSRILMKWNSMFDDCPGCIGSYSEVGIPENTIQFVTSNANFLARYPYSIIGAFGYGGDRLQSLTDQFVTTAKAFSNQNLRVIVSNEMDFAQDFEKSYGNDIPSLSVSFGNEWDLDCAAMAEVSARLKRSVEKLRTAEGLATLVSLKQMDFMQGREEARDLAWMNIGLFWEHDWQGNGTDLTSKRIEWTRSITSEIENYVDSLQTDALAALGAMIPKLENAARFYVFNPLSWIRTDYVDYEIIGSEPLYAVELESGQEIPSQIVIKDDRRWLRILARDVPAIGYKVYEIRTGVSEVSASEISVNGATIENQFYKLTVDGRGAITGLLDKQRGNRQLTAEISGRLMNDLGPGTGHLEIESQGSVSVTLLATADAPLQHTSRVTLFQHLDRVEIQNDIIQNFNAIQTWGFGFAMQNPDIYHEEVGAILHARLANDGGHYSPRNARYDWLTLNHFADINDGSEFGITLSNADCYFMRLGDSTAGKLDTQTPQINVLVGTNDLNGVGGLADQGGDNHFLQRFALRSHGTYNAVAAMRFALEHQNPLVAAPVIGGDLYPEKSYSLLQVDNPNVLLWALKPAEDGLEAGVVARVWNLADEPVSFSLQLNEDEIRSALALSHIETPTRILPIEAGKLVDSMNQQQIKTYAVFPAKLPYTPITTGLTAVATTGPVSQSTAVPRPETTATSPANISPSASSAVTPATTPAQQGKGCWLGLLDALFGVLK